MNNDSQFQIGEYCVFYLDIMGQKKWLAELAKCEKAEAQKRVNDLAEPLLRFRKGVGKRVQESLDDTRTLLNAMIPNDSPQKDTILKTVDDVSVGIQQFSDSTLLYVKMGSPVSFVALFMMVEFVLFRMIDETARGFLLRGGIAIGNGWEVEKNCLCGRAISDAYDLESKVSNWGRVTVSELFLTRLKGICGLAEISCGCWFSMLLRPMVKAVQRDIDGVLFLDYLNPAVEELYKREHFSSDWLIERIERGYSFIKEQLERFQSKGTEELEAAQLALRYDIMRGYWKSRLEMWASLQQSQGGAR